MSYFINLLNAAQEQPPKNKRMNCPNCMEAVWERTVRKENENHGRTFIKCKACDEFYWTDAGQCVECQRPMQRFKTKKEGPNQGKWFITCPACDTFKWEDE